MIKFEAMLLRWAETSNGGATIVLQLADPDELAPFKMMTLAKGKMVGQRLQIVAVEIDDQELPKDQPAPQKGGPLSVLAARWCKDPEFQDWLPETFGAEYDPSDRSELATVSLLRKVCMVKSRAELDHNPDAAARFESYIRSPYRKHQSTAGSGKRSGFNPSEAA